MKNNKHEALREKFWNWWDNSSFVEIGFGAFLFIVAVLMLSLVFVLFYSTFHADTADLPPDTPTEGIARIMPDDGEASVWMSPACVDDVEAAEYRLESYIEGEGPAPEWWDPEEPMAAEWEDNAFQRTDAGCPDWNYDTTIWGWDGHGTEAWEMDLFARIFYLEFWQPDMMLCEAGCDAILRLWESGEKGRTLGEVLSSRNEDGSWTYSVYPDVWTTDYDAEGLAWCREYTAERFYSGPEWVAPYFRLDYYHDWAVPAYQIGNVYFSVGGER